MIPRRIIVYYVIKKVMKILAGVLTYNRLTLLKDVFLIFGNQSLKPTNILVINNGSTDGTKDLNQNKHIIK